MAYMDAEEIKKLFDQHQPKEDVSHLIAEIDKRFAYAAKAMANLSAITTATIQILISKGVCTEAEFEQAMSQAKSATVDRLNKDSIELAKEYPENADEIRSRYAELTSSLTQTSSGPE